MSRATPIRILLIALAVLTAGGTRLCTNIDERFDEAVRVMRRATTARSSGEHILLLSSLRQLGDPELQPLFSSLSQTKNPTIQINAVLGLGELSKSHRIDPWKLSQIKDTRFRALAIIEAKDNSVIGADELRQILTWDDLTEDLRVYVMLMLVSMDESVDPEALSSLMITGKLPGTRAYAALALRQLGRSDGTDAALGGIDSIPPQVRDAAVREMIGTVAYLHLSAASAWVDEQLQSGELTSATESLALHTLLVLDPAGGAARWQERYAAAATAGAKVRLALMLLEQADKVDEAAFAPVAQEENELLASLGRIGMRIASDETAVSECIDLIAQHHAPSTAWVLQYARTIEPEQAATLYSAVIVDSLEEGAALNDRLELARLASSELLKIDTAALRTALETARTRQRRLTVESILSGALTAAVPEALTLIDGIEGWNSTRAESLALIIKARYAESLTEDQLSRLSLVFRGGGSVSSAGEVQAAWLYLQRTHQQGQALAAILSDLSNSPDH